MILTNITHDGRINRQLTETLKDVEDLACVARPAVAERIATILSEWRSLIARVVLGGDVRLVRLVLQALRREIERVQ